MDEPFLKIIDEMKTVSGPYIQPNERPIYSSYHHPNFTFVNTIRNTLKRLCQFERYEGVDYTNKKVLDLGSNLGAISIELARRGAKVTGVEFNKKRVELSNLLATHLNLDANFICDDLNTLEIEGHFDLICCMSVDHYTKLDRLLNIIRQGDVCYYESNLHHYSTEELRTAMLSQGLFVNYLGPSEGGRRVFLIGTKKYQYLGGHAEAKNGKYVKTYKSQDEFDNIKRCYEKIKNVHGVVKMTFNNKSVTMPDVGNRCLLEVKDEEIEQCRKSFIRFMVEMNKCGFAHRDLHSKNILVSDKQIFIIDWDFVCPNPISIQNCYDVTGSGLESPRLTENAHIFKKNRRKSITDILDIKIEDFYL